MLNTAQKRSYFEIEITRKVEKDNDSNYLSSDTLYKQRFEEIDVQKIVSYLNDISRE